MQRYSRRNTEDSDPAWRSVRRTPFASFAWNCIQWWPPIWAACMCAWSTAYSRCSALSTLDSYCPRRRASLCRKLKTCSNRQTNLQSQLSRQRHRFRRTKSGSHSRTLTTGCLICSAHPQRGHIGREGRWETGNEKSKIRLNGFDFLIFILFLLVTLLGFCNFILIDQWPAGPVPAGEKGSKTHCAMSVCLKLDYYFVLFLW